MKTRLKKFLNKHKNRIFSFIAVIACIPLFSITSYAFSVPLSSIPIKPATGSSIYFDIRSSTGNTLVNANYDSGEYSTEFHINSDILNVNKIIVNYRPGFNGSFNFDSFDYYIACTFYFKNSQTNINGVNYVSIHTIDSSGSDKYFVLSSLDTAFNTIYGEVYSRSFSFVGKMPDNFSVNSLEYFDIDLSGDIYAGQYNEFIAFLYQVPKGTDEETVNSLISAINNQTTTLGGKIDDTNDFIDKGNGSTGGIVSGNNSAIDNLDDVVSEYRATEETFFNDFNTNQQAITSDIVGWSWGGLVNCANWVGDTLTSYYNNMGDFRQYIIYPLMLGIALFFLGRGGSIIGHLFRKPTETTVNTRSVFRREGNTRYTTTTTSRQGGVFRK